MKYTVIVMVCFVGAALGWIIATRCFSTSFTSDAEIATEPVVEAQPFQDSETADVHDIKPVNELHKLQAKCETAKIRDEVGNRPDSQFQGESNTGKQTVSNKLDQCPQILESESHSQLKPVSLVNDGMTQKTYWSDIVMIGLVISFGLCLFYYGVLILRITSDNRDIVRQFKQHLDADIKMSGDTETDQPQPQLATDNLAYTSEKQAKIVSTETALPKVRFSKDVLTQMVRLINQFRAENRGVETGFALTGKVIGSGPNRQILVDGFIDAGKNVERSAGHCKFDRPFQQKELELLQLFDGETCHIGDAHLHPGCMDRCSSGDYETDLANVRANITREMVFVIATASSYGFSNESRDSIYLQGLKLDFFYLGRSSNYQYQKFLPEVTNAPMLSISQEFRLFVEADPIRARLDFGNLRRLANYKTQIFELSSRNGLPLCLELTHRTRGYKVIILFSSESTMKPYIAIQTGNDVLKYEPPFLNSDWLSVVWFTPIILAIEKEIPLLSAETVSKTDEQAAGIRPMSADWKQDGSVIDGPKTEDGCVSAIRPSSKQ